MRVEILDVSMKYDKLNISVETLQKNIPILKLIGKSSSIAQKLDWRVTRQRAF